MWTMESPKVVGHFQLTAVETDVARLIADGCNAREIAAALGITTNTARCHVQHLLVKTGAKNKAHLVALLFVQGNSDRALVAEPKRGFALRVIPNSQTA